MGTSVAATSPPVMAAAPITTQQPPTYQVSSLAHGFAIDICFCELHELLLAPASPNK
jgi:hypothetical protein